MFTSLAHVFEKQIMLKLNLKKKKNGLIFAYTLGIQI